MPLPPRGLEGIAVSTEPVRGLGYEGSRRAAKSGAGPALHLVLESHGEGKGAALAPVRLAELVKLVERCDELPEHIKTAILTLLAGATS